MKYFECPKCKRLTIYPPRHLGEGDKAFVEYIHEKRRAMMPFPHDQILDYCVIRKAEGQTR